MSEEDILGELPDKRVPTTKRVEVLVNMRHLRNYGRDPNPRLTYGCGFPVAVGDQVRIPPSPQNQQWTLGTVVALDPVGYDGPVKNIRPK